MDRYNKFRDSSSSHKRVVNDLSELSIHHQDDKPSLSMNERIVWISDNGPEYGYVRWLGKLPDIGQDWMAGVEFDNPVGSGTGLYKEHQLFETQMNHASLVPIIGLMKASDFDEAPDPPIRTTSINLIDNSNMSNSMDTHKHHIYPIQQQMESSNTDLLRTKYTDGISSGGGGYRPPPQLDTRYTSREGMNLDDVDQLDLIDRLDSQLSVRSNRGENQSHRSSRDDDNLVPHSRMIVNNNYKNASTMLKSALGKSRGIQGHNNSCYLDATLFAMFSSTSLFESLLYRPRTERDIPEYDQVQRVLREEIVRPLREEFFVSADQVMLLRTLLEKSSTVEGLTNEEKDPEEFLNLLLNQILRAEPYLKLSSGLESFFYQLIVDKDESIILPTVQDLFDQSFLNSTIRLREIPPCLLIQMPRFGRQYKMYSRIIPSMQLDITDVLESVPRACCQYNKDCENLARFECKNCFGERSNRFNTRLSNIAFCNHCFQAKHFSRSHATGIEDHDRSKTALTKMNMDVQQRYSAKSISSNKDKEIPRIRMDLFAVLCIETSHYVCFVKCGTKPESPWCFFDSMADRKGWLYR